jgi:hypothetical protein
VESFAFFFVGALSLFLVFLSAYGSDRFHEPLSHLVRRFATVRRVHPARLGMWREAARAAGVTGVSPSRRSLRGHVGSLSLRISRYANFEEVGTRVSISGPELGRLAVRPQVVGATLQGTRGVREVETGDDAFDAAAWVEGTPAVAQAILGAANRRALGALLQGRLERKGEAPFLARGHLEGGALVLEVPDRRSRWDAYGDDLERASRLGALLSEAIALAQRLAAPADVARRLADNLRSEPEGSVRRQCLLTLVREFPEHPATGEALRAACDDPDASVRLQAGLALGAEGRETLVQVARGEGAEDAVTERAVAGLGARLSLQEAQELLGGALRTRREATARACLHALGRKGAEAVAPLAKVLALETPELATAAAEALGGTGDAEAEAPLVGALGSPHEAVRLAAARALGRSGTTVAVVALREAEASDPRLRAAARQAIAEIQARAKGALPGQLSLAESNAGALSVAEDEPGQLSLAEEAGTGEPQAPLRQRVRE